MHSRWFSVVVCGLVLAASGCDAPAEDQVELRSREDNGFQLNGFQLNGFQLNGFQLNGFQLNGFQLNGFQLNGFQLNGVTLSGSSFTGTRPDNQVSSGTALTGTLIRLTSGTTQYTLRIDAITVSPDYPDVYHHMISVRDDAIGTWSPLCADDDGTPVAAIPVQNWWNAATGARVDDPGAVTLACRNGAIGKCIDWGYRPWATKNGASLRDHHQACTRMVRADYCGDGRSFTYHGTPIDIYDRIPLQMRATQYDSDWNVEAEWGPNGAVCVGDSLRLEMFDVRGVTYAYPTCLATIADLNDCGSLSPTRGGKIADAYCDAWESDYAACVGPNGYHGDDHDDYERHDH